MNIQGNNSFHLVTATNLTLSDHRLTQSACGLEIAEKSLLIKEWRVHVAVPGYYISRT